jgi:hypothetical protein
MAKTAASAGAACRYHCRQSGKGCVSCKPKANRDRRCDDTFPGQYNRGPWDGGGESGAEDVRYGTGTNQQGMPCEVIAVISISGCVARLGSRIEEGVEKGAVFTCCAMLVFMTSSPVCNQSRRA